MKLKLLLFLILLSFNVFAQNFENINRYKVNYVLAIKNNKELIAIRSFVNDNKNYLLLVNPQTLSKLI